MPTPGSALRRVFDALDAARGKWIDKPAGSTATMLRNLRDFYGLDIQTRVLRPSRPGGGSKSKWRLVGMRVGADFHDFVRRKVVAQRDR